MKRMLTSEEVILNKRAIEKNQLSLSHLLFDKQYYELMLGAGLRVNYEKKLEEFKRVYAEVKQNIELLEKTNIALQDQIDNGVMPKAGGRKRK